MEYYEPERNSVFNVFRAPSPVLEVQGNSNGSPAEGGNLQFQIQYHNRGDLDADNVVITQTLRGLDYLSNTSGFPVITGTTSAGDPYVVIPARHRAPWRLDKLLLLCPGHGARLADRLEPRADICSK